MSLRSHLLRFVPCLVLLAGLAGCVQITCPPGVQVPCPTCVPSGRCPELQPVTRGVVEIDLAAVPKPGPKARLGRCYRALTAHECLCLALENAPLANLLATEALARGRENSLNCLAGLPGRQRSQLSTTVLVYSSEEVRNRSAGVALEAYFRLAEAEGRDDLLQLSLEEVDSLVTKAQALLKQGLRSPTDVGALRRQQSELRADETQIDVAIDQLNGKLKTLVGLPCANDNSSLWPTGALRVQPADVNCEACVAVALVSRADLNLLRALAGSINAQTLPVARQVLGGVNALLGARPASPCKLGSAVQAVANCLSCEEVETVRKQVNALLQERSRQAAEEVRQAARVVDGRFRLVALARQRDEIAQDKVADLLNKEKRGLPVGLTLPRARLDAHKARGELLHEVVEYQIAQAQLEQAQGILAARCAGKAPACAPPAALPRHAVVSQASAPKAGAPGFPLAPCPAGYNKQRLEKLP